MRKLYHHQALPTTWAEREALRDKGQFWTPDWVAAAMLDYVLKDSPNLVFDPATGAGAFAEALARTGKPIQFFGTDIDPTLLGQSVYRQPNCQVELRDFLKNPPARRFPAIVGNPPYIRHHRIDEATKKHLKQLTSRIGGFTLDGRAGLHAYFLVQALHLLEVGGRLAFILPADICEGKFATRLWQWISENFCLEAVATFSENATPFPGVDTNALVFFVRNAPPAESLSWLRVNEAHTVDFQEFVANNFRSNATPRSIQVTQRSLREALQTGLSRPPQTQTEHRYRLSDFAAVLRGIATGANEFFFLTKAQIEAENLPVDFFKRAIGRTRDAQGDVLQKKELAELEEKSRPTWLLSIEKPTEKLPKNLTQYLQKGTAMGLPERPLIRQRNPWFKMEKRAVPPLLFAYLGRRNARFIKNEAGVLPLTGFLCVYPIYTDESFVNDLLQVLNHSDTQANLALVGKSYGSGAVKVEPNNLRNLPIPEHLVEQFELQRPYVSQNGQLDLFREVAANYTTSQSA